jgi:hypothetical protein
LDFLATGWEFTWLAVRPKRLARYSAASHFGRTAKPGAMHRQALERMMLRRYLAY